MNPRGIILFLAGFFLGILASLLLAPFLSTQLQQSGSRLSTPIVYTTRSTVTPETPLASPALTVSKASSTLPTSALIEGQRNMSYIVYMSLSVQDVKSTVQSITVIAAKLGGYVSSTDFSEESGQRASVTIKVPAQIYKEAVKEISSLGRLDKLQENAIDVTDQWVDLNARLRNLKAEEDRLLQLLERATSISDMIQIEDRLSSLRYQIEFYEAQLKNLERSITYATINISISPSQKPLEWPSINPTAWIRDGVSLALNVISMIIIALIGLTPIIALVGASWIVYTRLLRRKIPQLKVKSGE
ncbi:MAG: DUF4349 domain-containing protein [Infirmifilum sp.]|jgi:hypothetical protein|uniref:DUF4349 domain-containing protein n=1 Tax=Infirmifilum TaxID=2856573 RepID=UPI003C7939B0